MKTFFDENIFDEKIFDEKNIEEKKFDENFLMKNKLTCRATLDFSFKDMTQNLI